MTMGSSSSGDPADEVRRLWEFGDFNAPLGAERARGLVERAVAAQPQTVLDVGCGWGELLNRMVEALPGARGVGLDRRAEVVERARQEARARGVAGRVRFVESQEPLRESAAAWVSCVGSGHAFGGPPGQALAGLWELVEPGGHVLFAEQYWRRLPTDAELGELYPGAALWQHVRLAELVDLATRQGFRPLAVHTATEGEWEDFENRYLAGGEEWLMANADHPGAGEWRAWAEGFRRVRLGVGREVYGFAYLVLGRPEGW